MRRGEPTGLDGLVLNADRRADLQPAPGQILVRVLRRRAELP